MGAAGRDLQAIVDWYSSRVFGLTEGPGHRPFYCETSLVGAFAVEPERLAANDEGAVFRLLVMLSMYQARRDTVIMALQRSLSAADVRALTRRGTLLRLAVASPCPHLRSTAFDSGCDPLFQGKDVDCASRPGLDCHVKIATKVMRRMADMGKMPTSIALHFGRRGALLAALDGAKQRTSDPKQRADELVAAFARPFRVGEKLATLFVSCLSYPTLYGQTAAWHPDVDGSDLVVVDTNVLRVVRELSRGAARSRPAVATWIRSSVRRYKPLGPAEERRASPRLVQQALYHYASGSNRAARGDACVGRGRPCSECVPSVCPFSGRKPRHA